MSKVDSNSGARKRGRGLWWKIPVSMVGLLFLLVILALATTQTGWFKNWLRGYVVGLANESIEGTLEVQSLHGNLFTSLRLEGIALRRGSDTLLTVEQVEASYDLKALLRKQIRFENVTIERPRAYLEQHNDSSWNFMDYLPPDTSAEESEFGFVVVLDDVTLSDGSVHIVSPDTLLPTTVDSIQVLFAMEYSSATQKLDLKKFTMKTSSPDFSLENLSFDLKSTKDSTTISDFMLETKENRFTGQATIPHDNLQATEATFGCDSLHLSEFASLMPDLDLPDYPYVRFEARLDSDTLALALLAVQDQQSLEADLHVSHPLALSSDSTWHRVAYRLQAGFSNFDPGFWLSDQSLDYHLTGEINVSGSGIEPENLTAIYELNLGECRVYGTNVSSASLSGEYSRGSASAEIDLNCDYGKGKIVGEFEDLLGVPSYSVDADVSQLNFGELLADDSLESDLNFNLQVTGSGTDPELMEVSAVFALGASRIVNFDLDTAYAEVVYRDEYFTVDTILATTHFARLDAGGGLGMDQTGRVTFEIIPNNLDSLSAFLESDTLTLGGALRGTVEGSLTDFVAEIEPELGDINFDDIEIDTLYGTMRVIVADTALAGLTGELTAERISFGDYDANSLTLSGERNGKIFELSSTLSVTEETRFDLKCDVSYDSIITMSALDLTLALPNQTWHGEASLLSINLDDETYSIDSLLMTTSSEQDTSVQVISANGQYSLEGAEDIRVNIRNLSLDGVGQLFQLEQSLEGRLNISAALSGTATDPLLSAEFEVIEGRVDDFPYQHLSGNAGYASDSLLLALELIASETDTITIDAYFPVSLSIADTVEVFSYDRPFSLTAHARSLPFASLTAFIPEIENANGMLAVEFTAGGTLRNPRATGSLKVVDASLKIPEYGIDYHQIAVDVEAESNTINIKEITMHRGGGVLKITGQLGYDSTIVRGTIGATDVRLTADDFYITRHDDYEVQIDANTNLTGNLNSAVFGGKVTVTRSRIYLPAFTEEAEAADLAGARPLLVQATRPALVDTLDSTRTLSDDIDDELAEQSEFYENLRGRMEIEIPRNTWVRSPELRVEVSGTVEVVKEGPEAELFGSISIVRGHYDLFGKRFVIDDGRMNFQGGVEMNPVIKIQAHHELRTAGNRGKRKFQINATGTAETPQLRFSLDDTEISEGDAASYLAFGRSLDQLTYGERTELSGGEEEGGGGASLASGVLASMVSSQITKALGSGLRVDVLDVQAQSDWKAATFVVGKYITRDLFVSYARAVGEIEDDDVTKQIVTLEYELTRIIYLQLIEGDAKASGFDIIFKWDNQKAF